MPRRKKNRRLLAPPTVKGFNVVGPRNRSEQIILPFEEYETIKLLDYDNLTQEEASQCMGVSRPTLTRIYQEARNKVARAFVEGKDIAIKGGHFDFDDNWYYCPSCQARFNLFESSEKVCPTCASKDIITLNEYYTQLK